MRPDDLAGCGDQGQPGLILYPVADRDPAGGVERDRVAQRRAEAAQVGADGLGRGLDHCLVHGDERGQAVLAGRRDVGVTGDQLGFQVRDLGQPGGEEHHQVRRPGAEHDPGV